MEDGTDEDLLEDPEDTCRRHRIIIAAQEGTCPLLRRDGKQKIERRNILMKRKVLAGLVVAGVLGISGAAFASVNINVDIDTLPKVAAKTKSRRELPEFKHGERPKMPRHSFDRRPPEFDGSRPPMSRDNRMPPHHKGAHSGDKRPPKPRKN